jgi:outer membrane protein TolC
VISVVAAEAPPTLSLSLQDCLELALKNNLGLRIARYSPEIALYNLSAARAGYEPRFNFSGQHNHDESGSRILTGGFEIPGSTSDRKSFNGGLDGSTPWGMTYGLSASASESSGESYDFIGTDTNGLPIYAPRSFQSSQSSLSFDVTQPLLKNFWIDQTRLTISLAKNGVKDSELGLKGTVIDLVTSVELAYYDLAYGYESLKVQKKALELAQRLLSENRKRVEVGALAPLDEKQSEAAVSARQADLIAAQRNLDFLENALKQLLSDNFTAWNKQRLEPTDGLAAERQLFDLQDSWAKAFEYRPDYLQAKLGLENQGIQLKYDHNQLYPQLDVFATYGYNGSGTELANSFNDLKGRDQPFYSYGGRLVIPLGNGSARNRYKVSQANYDRLLLGLKSTEQSIMVQIDNAIKLAQANYERIGATREAREYAEAALAAEQKKLENGKSTSFVVLQLQRDLTAAQSDEISALVQYKRSVASLAQAEGTTLERNKIDFTAGYAPILMSPRPGRIEASN